MKCRICYSNNLTKFLDLGSTPPADDFLVAGRPILEAKDPVMAAEKMLM